jgi:hypothetical protein
MEHLGVGNGKAGCLDEGGPEKVECGQKGAGKNS